MTSRQQWEIRWGVQAETLEHLATVTGGLSESLVRLQDWLAELAGVVEAAAARSLLAGDRVTWTDLSDVARQLRVEAGEQGEAAGDRDTAGYVAGELEQLREQADRWGAGWD